MRHGKKNAPTKSVLSNLNFSKSYKPLQSVVWWCWWRWDSGSNFVFLAGLCLQDVVLVGVRWNLRSHCRIAQSWNRVVGDHVGYKRKIFYGIVILVHKILGILFSHENNCAYKILNNWNSRNGPNYKLKSPSNSSEFEKLEKNEAVGTEGEKLTQSHLEINFLIFFFLFGICWPYYWE